MKKPKSVVRQKKVVKGWAVVLDDGFIPDFSIAHKMYDVYQIHSTRTGVDHLKRNLGKGWNVVPVKIEVPLKAKGK